MTERFEAYKENGRWLVNGKPYDQLNYDEKMFLNDFIADIKAKEHLFANSF